MSPYYKVVEAIDGGYGRMLLSAIATEPLEDAIVRTTVNYYPDAWVTATWQMRKFGYHLTTFSHLDYARRFADDYTRDMEIWRCRIQGRVWKLPPMLDLGALWSYAQTVPHARKWPDGTVMAKKVMLTKRVE
jgi:hypothetical protein